MVSYESEQCGCGSIESGGVAENVDCESEQETPYQYLVPCGVARELEDEYYVYTRSGIAEKMDLAEYENLYKCEKYKIP